MQRHTELAQGNVSKLKVVLSQVFSLPVLTKNLIQEQKNGAGERFKGPIVGNLDVGVLMPA